MFKTRNPGFGHIVTVYCRRCHCNEVDIPVLELSRAHHAPLCKECEDAVEKERVEEGSLREHQ